VPGFSAALFQQPYALNHHTPIDGLTHVVNRQQRDLRGHQRFHFDAGLPLGFSHGAAIDAVAFGLGLQGDFDVGQRQRMAQGNKLSRALTGHDAGKPGSTEYIAFFMVACHNQRQGFGLHLDVSFANSGTLGNGLVADIDHMSVAGAVKMSEVYLGHGPGNCRKFHCITGSKKMSIKVRYFASLKEWVGRAEDVADASSAGQTVRAIWQQLNPQLALPENVLMAINMEYVAADAAVEDGDELAFFPPVTGG
jgi:molybdopterin synthase sulfur carrier subunit